LNLRKTAAAWAAFITLSSMAASAWAATVIDLGAPTGQFSVATALNNTGLVGGYGQALDGEPPRALLWGDLGWTPLASATSYNLDVGAISDNGVVYGSSTAVNGNTYATVWTSPDQYTYLPGLNDFSMAHGVNNAGVVVGMSYNADRDARPVAWVGGNLQDLGTLGGPSGVAMAINNNGIVAGSSQIPGGMQDQATIWVGGVAQALSVPAELQGTGAMDINDLNQAVGVGYAYSNGQALLWDQGQVGVLASLGGVWDRANAINNAGQIVGLSTVSADPGAASHAVMWSDGQILDLNTFMSPEMLAAGWYLSEASDINEAGWVVGVARHSGLGQTRAFLLNPTANPVPEPATQLSLSLGLLALAGLARRRHRSRG
jgi:probable HAF family extracellular repeat protein